MVRDPGRAGLFGSLNLLGESPPFLEALRLVEKIARCDATVLVLGETGTGKELIARAIHYLGERRDFPFIPVNCGAIPESLVESELFGYTRGAFTDAKEAHPGVIAQAAGGTLFLDEVDTLSVRSQVALLRFLQDHEYRPVGAGAPRSADVRILASTNADLEERVARGAYRQDLFYRLNVLSVSLPPLRSRSGDVALLAQAFVERLCRQYRTGPRRFGAESIAALESHDWPGNVRELENLVHRAFLLCDGEVLQLPGRKPDDRTQLTQCRFRDAKARAIAEFERAYLAELLARTQGNISLAARLAGKERSRLGKLARKYGLARGYAVRTG